jgi:hypothetical protein
VEENGGKWGMEHLYKRRRNAAVQTNPVPKPHIIKTFICQIHFILDYTQYIPICQVLKHIKNPQKYPNMVDKSYKNVYNVWIIWGK